MTTLLVVEDDQSLNRGITLSLKRDGMVVEQAFCLAEAEQKLACGNIDLIILDVNLPDGSGFVFCEKVREHSLVPVIFLTANDMESDIVLGFELGGDDYVTKPFSLMVLRSRVMAILRRGHAVSADSLMIDELRFDFEKMDFFKQGQKLTLSKTEQKVLKLLLSHRGQILTREQLMDGVWGKDGEFVDENALTVTIKRLRAKIEDAPSSPKYIKTIYGLGYIWSTGAK